MTSDDIILKSLAVQPATGSEIGMAFAPETIKDRAGWGRKWLTRARNSGLVRAVGKLWTAADTSTGQDFTDLRGATTAPAIIRVWYAGADFWRSYKAPHAPRGTPPRQHYSRATRQLRFCNH